MSATRMNDCSKPEAVLHMALELGEVTWKLGLTTGLGQEPRRRDIDARDTEALGREIDGAKERFGLPAETPVVSCYEAGREGFWLHRWLLAHGVRNEIVDSSSIHVNRRGRLLREFARMQGVNRQIRELEKERARRIRKHDQDPAVGQVRHLMGLNGIADNSSWVFVHEVFGWRKIRNRREIGALVGLTGTPYRSGQLDHEQGISKAGNRRMRAMAIEIAWGWLKFQSQSALALWYQRRFGHGNKRLRRIGIVALARKLLVALWKYLETGVPPEGAELTDWRGKIHYTSRLA